MANFGQYYARKFFNKNIRVKTTAFWICKNVFLRATLPKLFDLIVW